MNEPLIARIKNWLLEDTNPTAKRRRRPSSTARRRVPPRNKRARTRRAPQASGNIPTVAAIGAVVVLAVAAAAMFIDSAPDAVIDIRASNLCPRNDEHITGKTFIHIDLTETLSARQRTELKKMLNTAAKNLKAREQLIISQMQTDQNAPRKEVQKFCSPDISRINVAGRNVTREKCPNIIAGKHPWARSLGGELRQQIVEACVNYEKLTEKVSDAAQLYSKVNVEQNKSYIVGGVEQIIHAANREPRNVPTRLIMFSDMLQNAEWFSQYRIKPNEWSVDNLVQQREAFRDQSPEVDKLPRNNINEVLICGLKSNSNVLDSDGALVKHETMWKNYFDKFPKVDKRDVHYTENVVDCAGDAEAMMQGRLSPSVNPST